MWGARGVIDVLLDGKETPMQRGLALEGVANERSQSSYKTDHVGIWDTDEEWNRSFAAHEATIVIRPDFFMNSSILYATRHLSILEYF